MKITIWKTIASLLVLGLFTWMGVSSLYFNLSKHQQTYEFSEDGENYIWIRTGEWVASNYVIIRRGKRDDAGRWHGDIHDTRNIYNSSDELIGQYEVHGQYANGLKHGIFEIYTLTEDSYDLTNTICFDMGHIIHCDKQQSVRQTDPTAFEILQEKHPLYLYDLQSFIDDEALLVFMDTLAAGLAKFDFEEEAFDSYYDDVLDSLSKLEPYKEMIGQNNLMSMWGGMDLWRSYELRLAVLDKQWSGATHTSDILKSTYAGYLQEMKQRDVTETDMEAFCTQLDSIMNDTAPVDRDGLYFVDSVDMSFFNALTTISSAEKSLGSVITEGLQLAGSGSLHRMHHISKQFLRGSSKSHVKSSPPDIVALVITDFVLQWYVSDMIRQSMHDAWYGYLDKPALLTTALAGVQAGPTAYVTGHVIDDGGSEVTQRGIAWGTIYNPTTDNNILASGSGTGMFNVALTGLTEGQTYYARTWATNSVGTAYGNVVKFEADQSTGLAGQESAPVLLSVFPVPARGQLQIAFQTSDFEDTVISLISVSGQLVCRQKVAEPGRHTISMDIEGLGPGIYFVRLDQGGATETRKVMIH